MIPVCSACVCVVLCDRDSPVKERSAGVEWEVFRGVGDQQCTLYLKDYPVFGANLFCITTTHLRMY